MIWKQSLFPIIVLYSNKIMFSEIKELQLNAGVSTTDVRFVKLLNEQFGRPNEELKAAMQYFILGCGCTKTNPAFYENVLKFF